MQSLGKAGRLQLIRGNLVFALQGFKSLAAFNLEE